MTNNEKLIAWVKQVEEMCRPDRVRWCDGSDAEYAEMLRIATALQVDPVVIEQTLHASKAPMD